MTTPPAEEPTVHLRAVYDAMGNVVGYEIVALDSDKQPDPGSDNQPPALARSD